MEKKYYFRGLGLGIIVTAVIMGAVLSGGKKELTDDEVIARAKELGMTENTRLLEPTDTDEDGEGAQAPAKPEPEKEPVKKDIAVAQPKDDATAAAKAEAEEKPEAAEPPETKEKPEAAEEASSADKKADDVEDGPQKDPAAQQDQAASPSGETAQNKKPASGTNEMTRQDEDTGQQASSAVSITIVSGDGSYTVAKKLEAAGVVSSASAYDDFLCQNGYDKRLRTGTFQIPAGASDEQIAGIVTNQP